MNYLDLCSKLQVTESFIYSIPSTTNISVSKTNINNLDYDNIIVDDIYVLPIFSKLTRPLISSITFRT